MDRSSREKPVTERASNAAGEILGRVNFLFLRQQSKQHVEVITRQITKESLKLR